MKRKRIKRLIGYVCLTLSLVLSFSLTGCFDLGIFEGEYGEYQDYYDAFGDVEGIFYGGSHTYDVEESLFNEYTVNYLDWDDSEEVESEEYVYIVIPFEREMKIESIALFISADTLDLLDINAFYYESDIFAPNKIKFKSSPDTEIVKVEDENGNEIEQEVEIVYDDPAPETSVARTICEPFEDDWSDFILSDFDQEGYNDGLLHTVDNGLLYIRINNNSGLFPESTACSLKFINLLVRAV